MTLLRLNTFETYLVNKHFFSNKKIELQFMKFKIGSAVQSFF